MLFIPFASYLYPKRGILTKKLISSWQAEFYRYRNYLYLRNTESGDDFCTTARSSRKLNIVMTCRMSCRLM